MFQDGSVGLPTDSPLTRCVSPRKRAAAATGATRPPVHGRILATLFMAVRPGSETPRAGRAARALPPRSSRCFLAGPVPLNFKRFLAGSLSPVSPVLSRRFVAVPVPPLLKGGSSQGRSPPGGSSHGLPAHPKGGSSQGPVLPTRRFVAVPVPPYLKGVPCRDRSPPGQVGRGGLPPVFKPTDWGSSPAGTTRALLCPSEPCSTSCVC